MAVDEPEKAPVATPEEINAHKKHKQERQKIAQDGVAAFIVGLAALLCQTYWFTIQGDCELGLCLTTMLTLEEYAALLFVAGLVNVKNKRDGDPEFLSRYELLGMDNISETTSSQVRVDAFKRRKKGTKIGKTMKHLHLLRVGQYEPGECIVASKQLTDGVDPPNFSRERKIRTVQRRLHNSVMPVIQPLLRLLKLDPGYLTAIELDETAKLKSLVEWVKLKELDEDPQVYDPPVAHMPRRNTSKTDGPTGSDGSATSQTIDGGTPPSGGPSAGASDMSRPSSSRSDTTPNRLPSPTQPATSSFTIKK